MSASEQIEEILIESHSYGIRLEVLAEAAKLLDLHRYDPVVAYDKAFNLVLSRHSSNDTP